MYLTFLGPGVSNFKNEGNPEIGGKGLRISLKKDDFFLSSFRFTEKLKEKYSYFPHTPHLHLPGSPNN